MSPSAAAQPPIGGPFARLVKSRHLFYYLLRRLQPALILDVGSRDGSDALEFRAVCPRARIVAIEAHPRLAEQMRRDPALARARIEVVHCAVSDADGEASFSVYEGEKRLGSLMDPGARPVAEVIRVPTRRLDGLPGVVGAGPTALWIDVEGAAHEALQGAERLLESVILLHLEAEWQEAWPGQKLAGDLERLLAQHGLVPVFTGMKRRIPQGNIVFARRDLARQVSGPGVRAASVLYRGWTRLARASERRA
jgi:FkbM family methyltransferase